MKKLLIMAAVAATFASCSTDNEDFVTQNEPQKIVFDAPVMNMGTRAGAITNATYPDAESFKVFANRHTGAYNGSWASNFMNGVDVSKVNTQWEPAQDYYWPKNGDMITFAAYSPADLNATTDCESVAYAATGLNVVGYKLNADLAQQKDLMFAPRVMNKTKDNSSTGVAIKFNHALSLINFTVKSANSGITITDIIVNNAKDKGTFNEGITDGATYKIGDPDATVKPAWSDQAFQTGSSSIFNVFKGRQSVTNNDPAAAVGDNLLMIPQDVTGSTITIKWEYTNGGSNVVLDEVTKNFRDLDISAWEIGKKYTYNITINLDKIYFNPSVDNWVDGGTGNIQP